jgi:hypothetical protein
LAPPLLGGSVAFSAKACVPTRTMRVLLDPDEDCSSVSIRVNGPEASPDRFLVGSCRTCAIPYAPVVVTARCAAVVPGGGVPVIAVLRGKNDCTPWTSFVIGDCP